MAQFDVDIEKHAPELYDVEFTADPLDGWNAVDDQQLAKFYRDGFMAIDNVFSMQQVQDAIDALAYLIEGKNPRFDNLVFEGKARGSLDVLTAAQRAQAVRKLIDFVDFDPRLKAMADDPHLRDIVARIIGTDHELLQEMALLKMPGGREKPWHQDRAYFNVPLTSPIIGVWIALDTASLENGCMHVLGGAHKDGPVIHFKRRDWQICDTDILGRRCTAVPLKPGGVMLFDSLLPHGTPCNATNHKRRALQFHYVPSDAPRITDEQRKEAFGSEGKNVSC